MFESLSILRCTHTQSRLRMAAEEECQWLNTAIAHGQVFDNLGRHVKRRLDAALINEQATYAYPIYDDIPHLLADTSIPLDNIPGQFTRGAW